MGRGAPLTSLDSYHSTDTEPKDPIALCLISLLKCLRKSTERLVLERLKWLTGPLHPSFYVYLPQTGATDCLTTFLNKMRQGHRMAVFINLEKAFELASCQPISQPLRAKALETNFYRGGGIFSTVEVRTSTVHQHIHGTPQGSILSSFLFNVRSVCIKRSRIPQTRLCLSTFHGCLRFALQTDTVPRPHPAFLRQEALQFIVFFTAHSTSQYYTAWL